MGALFGALRIASGAKSRAGFWEISSCPHRGDLTRESISLCHGMRGCSHGVNMSFWRSDHLQPIPASQGHVGHIGSNCPGWDSARYLASFGVVLLSRGAHVNDYELSLRGKRAFHEARAIALAQQLAPFIRDTTFVFIKAHWGAFNEAAMSHNESQHVVEARAAASSSSSSTAADHHAIHLLFVPNNSARDLDAANAAIQATGSDLPVYKGNLPQHGYNWHLMPMINDVTADVLRRHLPAAHMTRAGESAGLAIIDPTRAIAQRLDCHRDPLHVYEQMYLGSTWRMVQNALWHALWPDRRA